MQDPIIGDVGHRKVRVSAVPYIGHYLPGPRPRLEPLLVPGPFEKQESGLGEFSRIAPNACKSDSCLVHKISQVALPAPIKIAEEKEPLAPIDDDPSGIVISTP